MKRFLSFALLALSLLAAATASAATVAVQVGSTPGATSHTFATPSGWSGAVSRLRVTAGNCAPTCAYVQYFNSEAEDRMIGLPATDAEYGPYGGGYVAGVTVWLDGVAASYEFQTGTRVSRSDPWGTPVADKPILKSWPGGASGLLEIVGTATGATVKDGSSYSDDMAYAVWRLDLADYAAPAARQAVASPLDAAPVPVPAALPLAGAGLASLLGLSRLMRRKG